MGDGVRVCNTQHACDNTLASDLDKKKVIKSDKGGNLVKHLFFVCFKTFPFKSGHKFIQSKNRNLSF